MKPIGPGSAAPEAPGGTGRAKVLAFYKVTCPVCQMAAPKIDALSSSYPGFVSAIGQDPEDELTAFADGYGMGSVPTSSDTEPYDLSNAFGVRVVPTLFLIDEAGTVRDVSESWDRDAFNRISRGLAEFAGADYVQLSEEGDGLPSFRPG